MSMSLCLFVLFICCFEVYSPHTSDIVLKIAWVSFLERGSRAASFQLEPADAFWLHPLAPRWPPSPSVPCLRPGYSGPPAFWPPLAAPGLWFAESSRQPPGRNSGCPTWHMTEQGKERWQPCSRSRSPTGILGPARLVHSPAPVPTWEPPFFLSGTSYSRFLAPRLSSRVTTCRKRPPQTHLSSFQPCPLTARGSCALPENNALDRADHTCLSNWTSDSRTYCWE